MLSHLEPYLLAPSSLTPTALRQRATALLADPVALAAARAALRDTGAEAVRVRGNPLYDAWLVRCDTGAALLPTPRGHAAFAVVEGVLREAGTTADGVVVPAEVRSVPAGVVVPGEVRSLPAGGAHRLEAVTPGTLALHLSSPPRRMPAPRPAQVALGATS